VKIFIKDAAQQCTFMVDSGADMSIFKAKKLYEIQPIKVNSGCIINGITQGKIETIGLSNLTLKLNEDMKIEHDFQIVDENFNFLADGILGRDFLSKYRCILDYNKYLLMVKIGKQNLELPLLDSWITIPARSEVVRKYQENLKTESLVEAQEISPGVFCANAIVGTEPLIRFINTNSKDVLITNFKPKFTPLDQFNICQVKIEESSPYATQSRIERLMEEIKIHNIPNQEQKKIKNLCAEFHNTFYLTGDDLSTNNFYKQSITLIDNTPSYVKNYRLPHSQKSDIEEQIKQMLNEKIIEHSVSPFNSPLLVVPKKGGESRVVVDFRKLNKKIFGDKFPLPRIEEILDQLGRAKFFSILDLKSGFYQIELEKSSRGPTAFSTDTGHYEFKRLPMGLKISPNSFQRMMAIAMAGLPPETSFLYIDDLVVTGCSEEHHLKNLKLVFSKLRERNLKLNPSKCLFMQTSVTYLGHLISGDGIQPDPTKFESIKNYPKPVNADEVRRFVAFCNYYRRFVEDFAKIANPLNRLLRKNINFNWTSECQLAFEKLKAELMSPKILQYPNFDREFVLLTDASDIACGAVLAQEHNGINMPIAYASKATIEKELTAIHWGVNHFKPYLFGKKFKILTDHKPLVYLFSMKNPTSKLTRMRWDLEEFEYTVEHIAGKQNCAADALSRVSMGSEMLKNMNRDVEKNINIVQTRAKSRALENTPIISQKNTNGSDQPRIFEAMSQLELKKLYEIEFYIKEKEKEKVKLVEKTKIEVFREIKLIRIPLQGEKNIEYDLKLALAQVEENSLKFEYKKVKLCTESEIFKIISREEFKDLINNATRGKVKIVLYDKPIFLKDKHKIEELVNKYHETPIGGHMGITRTIKRLKLRYKFDNMKKFVKKLISNCELCKQNKHKNRTKMPMVITNTPAWVFDSVAIDTIGPFPKTIFGNRYAVTLQDELSKFVEIIPIATKEAAVLARAIVEKFICTYGAMKAIKTDMGTEYLNETFSEVGKYLKIDRKHSAGYRPETLGALERNHKCFNEYVRSFINDNGDDWDVWSQYYKFCYNTTPNNHGYTPFELVFGRKANLPIDVLAKIAQPVYNVEQYANELQFRLKMAYDKTKTYLEKEKEARKLEYDKNLRIVNFKIGDKVWIRDEARQKLDPVNLGPYRIIKLEGVNVVIKNKKNKNQTIHSNRLILDKTI
jgi:Reverse transcriptase (RNA-dependent DNA polymerase)/RNase H-like domain found in reverse transcriptase/Integrase zinc binding domain/Retroviral aspartyl protease